MSDRYGTLPTHDDTGERVAALVKEDANVRFAPAMEPGHCQCLILANGLEFRGKGPTPQTALYKAMASLTAKFGDFE